MKIAVITPLPPEDTGVAEFSKNLYKGNNLFDIFWEESDYSYDIKDIFKKTLSEKYDAIIFTLANSNHNFRTAQLLQDFKGFPALNTKIIIHIHDPVLTNISREIYRQKGEDFLDFYRKRDSNQNISDMYQAFDSYGYTGLDSLINEINIETIIFHSKSAETLTMKDLAVNRSRINNILHLFHPCFDDYSTCIQANRKFDVGIFGVMDDGSKLTSNVINVLKKAHEFNLISNAVICGYNAKEYFEYRELYKLGFITCIDKASHDEMFDVMKQTKCAIQPRAKNTGESSGIIPMLVAANTPSIISNLGAFAEFPDEIAQKIENKDFERECFKKLRELLTSSINYLNYNEYYLNHSPEKFINTLINHIKEFKK